MFDLPKAAGVPYQYFVLPPNFVKLVFTTSIIHETISETATQETMRLIQNCYHTL